MGVKGLLSGRRDSLGRQVHLRRKSCCTSILRAGGVAQMVEGLPVCKALGSNPSPVKTGVVAQACNPSIWEVKTGGSEIQGHP